jgi:hypothetical protein
MRGLTVTLLALGAVWGGCVLGGCGEKCDPGYHLDDHLCYVDLPAENTGGAAGAPDGNAGAGDACESTFGADCLSNADCVCDSDFCAGYPGQVGFCTRSGCDRDPSLCPADYACLDLSSFGPGLPNICAKP